MKVIFVCALVAFLYFSGVESHTELTNIRINGQNYNNCLRPQYPGNLYAQTQMGAQWPISSSNFLTEGITSSNYTCGFLPFAGRAAASKCSVRAGDQVGVSYYHGAGYGTEDPVLDAYIARSHKGPFMAFMARSDTGAGNVWFKIFQEGKMTESTSSWEAIKWASPDRLLATGGYMNFQIPSDIAPGNYLLRTEIIAMHDSGYHGAQPYVHCIELTVTGSGNAQPAGVSIPGNWDYNHPGITYNIYNDYRKAYPFPGPEVYVPGSAPATTGPATTGPATTGPATTGPATTGPATTGPYTTTGVYTTTGQAVPRITAKVTVKINVDPSKLDSNYFVYEVTQVLNIPSSSIASVTVDIDKSGTGFTVIEFTIWNDVKADGTRVDPVAASIKLRDMALNNDVNLQGTSYLIGMEVLDTQAAPSTTGDQASAGSSSGGGSSSTTIIIAVVVVAGVVVGGSSSTTIIIAVVVVAGVVVAGVAVAAFFIIKKKRSTGWI